MKIIEFPNPHTIHDLLRGQSERDSKTTRASVEAIFKEVLAGGDRALIELSKRYDRVELTSLRVQPERLKNALQEMEQSTLHAVKQAEENIRRFHKAQSVPDLKIETSPGIVCERRAVPIERVGLYVPGGSAPLVSTLLMLAIPAQIAGCREIVVVSPPPIHPIILGVLSHLNIEEVYEVGGAQAIAALGFGTDSIRKVSKIFGPGNQYVTVAKQLLAAETLVAIDLPAGPSEVLIIADDSANPAFVAADLLSQAEHGMDSQVVLVTTSRALIGAVEIELANQLESLPRQAIAAGALERSWCVLVHNLEEALSLSNVYGPEHLILAISSPDKAKSLVENAGSVFLGHYTPESLGDYASGTNHTLPTGGAAHGYSGVSLSSFQKFITFQEATQDGVLRLGPTVERLAQVEGLHGHARAVALRYGR